MKTTLILPDEVLKRAKKRAAELGISLSAFAERSIRDALTSKPERRKRPLHAAWGNPRQRINLTVEQINALRDDDLERWSA